MSKPFPVIPVVLGVGALAAIGYILFSASEAKAATTPPQPQPGPSPTPAPTPAQPANPPPPVPIPPKLDTGPGSQVSYPLLVTGTGVNVRSGPSTKHTVIATVTKGDRLQLPHSNAWADPTPEAPQGWNAVILKDGRAGWVASHLMVLEN